MSTQERGPVNTDLEPENTELTPEEISAIDRAVAAAKEEFTQEVEDGCKHDAISWRHDSGCLECRIEELERTCVGLKKMRDEWWERTNRAENRAALYAERYTKLLREKLVAEKKSGA